MVFNDIQFTFSIISLAYNPTSTSNVIGKLVWECVASRNSKSILLAGHTYLKREFAPTTPVRDATTEELTQWLIESDGGAQFLNMLYIDANTFLLDKELEDSVEYIIGTAPQSASWQPEWSVSRFQAIAALTQLGYIAAVNEYMNNPATDPMIVLAYREATEFRRESPTVSLMQGVLGLSNDQIDELFALASTITA